jgi:hypothetical protein
MRKLVMLVVIAGLIVLPILALMLYLQQLESTVETAAETEEAVPTV